MSEAGIDWFRIIWKSNHMKTRIERRCLTFWRGFFVAGLTFLGSTLSWAVPLTGANGKVVDFSGIKSAGPGGLRVKITAEGSEIDVPWERFDLPKLKSEHPEIFAAYEKAQTGQHTDLDLGSYAPQTMPQQQEVKNFRDGAERHGWYETGGGGGKFAIQMPDQEVKGVLLVSMGQDGRSIRYMGGVGVTRWAKFAEKFQFAIMSYEFPVTRGDGADYDITKAAPYIFADKSGEGVLSALESFAEKSKKPALKEVPIAVFGFDVLGAAFAFNFAQNHPDRVIAAVAAKGAFYAAELNENAAKVPLLLLWGEYDQEIERWNPFSDHQETYEKGLELRPNWTHAMEPRGPSGETPLSFTMGMTFLNRMILARLNPEGGLKEMDREDAWVGNLKTKEIRRMEDPGRVLEPHETWLPNGEVAKLWEEFSNGTLAPDTQ